LCQRPPKSLHQAPDSATARLSPCTGFSKPDLKSHRSRVANFPIAIGLFRSQKPCFTHRRARNFSHGACSPSMVSGCRTIVRPLPTVRSASNADDNWTALIGPSTARFTDLGMSISRPTVIQQRTYDGRRRISHLRQRQECRSSMHLGTPVISTRLGSLRSVAQIDRNKYGPTVMALSLISP
jgi:hypothetical protein